MNRWRMKVHMRAVQLLCLIFLTLNCSLVQAADIGVELRGEGPAMVFIPGLNSASAGFDSTCEAFIDSHQCVLLHLPGFAGRETMPLESGFLVPVRDRIIALLRDRHLRDVTLVGHSLGGTLSLMLALEAPELINRLVLIDAVPFYPAVQNPAMTAAMGQVMATRLKAQMEGISDEQFRQNAAASTNGMSNNAQHMPMLVEWSESSDRMTTAQAMADMLTTDLRQDIVAIEQPALVLGAWKAYEAFGSTLDSTRAVFAEQYTQLPNVEIRMSQSGYHFLMLDDSDWVNAQIQSFLEQ